MLTKSPVIATPVAVAGGKVFSGVCLSVCQSVYPHNISKTAAAMITELDTEMFRRESLQPIYFGFGRSNVEITRHKKQRRREFLHSSECWLLFKLNNEIYVASDRRYCRDCRHDNSYHSFSPRVQSRVPRCLPRGCHAST